MVDRGRLGERAQTTGATRAGMASGVDSATRLWASISVLCTETATHAEAAVEALGALIDARPL